MKKTNFTLKKSYGIRSVFRNSLISLFVLMGSLSALAGGANYNVEISGMTCGGCVSAIKSKLCKMDGVAECKVEVGKATLVSKDGIKLDENKIKELVSQAGSEYKATKIESGNAAK